MPFKLTPGLIVVGIIVIVIIFGVIAAVASGGGRKTKPADLCLCTVNGDIGIQTVNITNQNTGKSILRTASELPYSFNFTADDTLKFQVTMIQGYKWNAWEINQNPWFAQDNPFLIRTIKDLTIEANCIVEGT